MTSLCTKFVIGRGCARASPLIMQIWLITPNYQPPQTPPGGAYNSPPEPLVGLILFGRFALSIRALLALNVKAQLFFLTFGLLSPQHFFSPFAPN